MGADKDPAMLSWRKELSMRSGKVMRASGG